MKLLHQKNSMYLNLVSCIHSSLSLLSIIIDIHCTIIKILFQDLFDHRDEILAKQSAEFNAKMAIGRAIVEENSNVPHCPTCSSTNLKRISTTTKVPNVALFGLLGNKRKKTFHCNNCGSNF